MGYAAAARMQKQCACSSAAMTSVSRRRTERYVLHRVSSAGDALLSRVLSDASALYRADSYEKEFAMPKRRDYDRSDIAKMQAALKALPKKEREKQRFTVPDLVREMRMEIRAALGRGYTLDEVIIALNSQGTFDLKTPTIKRYIAGAKKKKVVSTISGKFSERKSASKEGALKTISGETVRKKSRAVDLPSSADL
jgi:HD superfamily phosphohydrolase